MLLFKRFSELSVTKLLRFTKNAVLKVVDSSNNTTSISIDEIKTLAVSTRLVTLTSSTTLTQATHDSKVILLGEVGGDALLTVTLPAATGSGAVYHFKVSVVNTSNYVIVVADASDTMDGTYINLQDAADTVVGFEADGTDDTFTMNGTTTGGAAIGDWVEFVDIAADQFSVTGVGTATGTEVTPFSATI